MIRIINAIIVLYVIYKGDIMEIVFDRLPENLEELKALPAASLNEPEYGAALFLAAMMMYEKDREQTWQMLEFLYGPAGLSTFTKQFINDRMQDNKFYKVKSYFKGSSPENNYEPSMPLTTVEIQRRDDSMVEGRCRLFMKSTGADTPREIRMRHKPSTNQWFVEDQMLLADIRVPVAADPWA